MTPRPTGKSSRPVHSVLEDSISKKLFVSESLSLNMARTIQHYLMPWPGCLCMWCTSVCTWCTYVCVCGVQVCTYVFVCGAQVRVNSIRMCAYVVYKCVVRICVYVAYKCV